VRQVAPRSRVGRAPLQKKSVLRALTLKRCDILLRKQTDVQKKKMSVVREATILHRPGYLTPDEAAALRQLLDRADLFQRFQLYFWDAKAQRIVSSQNWRQSYWLGEHAQAVQETGRSAISERGERVPIPTDFVQPYEWPPALLALKHRIETEVFFCLFFVLFSFPLTHPARAHSLA